MTTRYDLRENFYRTLENKMSLVQFEQWLYNCEDLSRLTNERAVLEAYSFNYKQPDAKYQFRKLMFEYFSEDEYFLWKVKSNLADLVAGTDDRDRILFDFSRLKARYDFLDPIADYIYRIDEIHYYGNMEDVLAELKEDSETLLFEITQQELALPAFTLNDYVPIKP